MTGQIGFPTNPLGILHDQLSSDLSNLREYLQEVESALASRLKTFQSSVEDAALKLSPDAQDDWCEHNYGSYVAISETFPMVLHNSLFGASFALVESHLLRICSTLARRRPRSVALADLKDRGLDLASTYMTKVQQLPFPAGDREWQRIKDYQRVRNLLSHNQGRLRGENKDKRVRDFASQNPSLAFIDLNRVSVTSEGCLDLIKTAEHFFINVFKMANNGLANENLHLTASPQVK